MVPENIDIKPMDLFYIIPMVIALLTAKFIFQKTVYFLLETCQNINFLPPSNPSRILETTYLKSKKLNQRDPQECLNRRYNEGEEYLNNLCENVFQYLYYVLIFTYGIAVLWNKPWLWNISKCWEDFDHQKTSVDIWWYYMISQTFYYSNFVTHMYEAPKKHFYFILVHDVITILILTLSWCCSFVRIGAVGMMVHDISNVFLQASKIAFALRKEMAHACSFVVFSLVWLVTRMGVFPLWIIRNCLSVQVEFGFRHYGSILLIGLLFILFGLHCFSTCMIFRIFSNAGKLVNAKTDV